MSHTRITPPKNTWNGFGFFVKITYQRAQNKICMACTLEVVWDYTSFWQFDIMFCSELDNHVSVKQVMSI